MRVILLLMYPEAELSSGVVTGPMHSLLSNKLKVMMEYSIM